MLLITKKHIGGVMKFKFVIFLLLFSVLVIYAADPDLDQSGLSANQSSLVDSVARGQTVYVKGKAIPGTANNITDVYRSGTNTGEVYILLYDETVPAGSYDSYTIVSISNFNYSSSDSIFTFQFTVPTSIDTSYHSFQLLYGLTGQDDFDDIYGTRYTTYIDAGSYSHSNTYTLDSNHQGYLEMFIDEVTETPLLAEPHTNEHDNNPTDVSFTLPEAGADGTVELIFKRTGERHVCTIADESQGVHTFDINPSSLSSSSFIETVTGGNSLTENVEYTVTIKYQDALSNPADSVSITGYVYDTITETPTFDSPATDATVGEDFSVQYDMPENAKLNTVKISISRTGGEEDPASPHIAIINDETAGDNKIINLDTSNLGNTPNTTEDTAWEDSHLVSGAIYSIKIEYQDFLGNTASAVTHTNITFDNGIVIRCEGIGMANNFQPGVDNQPILRLDMWYEGNTSTAPNVTSIKYQITGTCDANDFNSGAFKLWVSTDTNFDASVDTQIGSAQDYATSITFSGFSEALEKLSAKSKKYFFITADVANDADTSHNLGAEVQNANDVTTDSGTIASEPFPIDSGDQPLPVVLSSFFADFISNIPILTWTTFSETNNQGWNVYRATSQNFGQSEKLNGTLISGQGTTTQITKYVFRDQTSYQYGNTYYYWIESVDNSGATFLYDSIQLTIPENEDAAPNLPVTYGLYDNYPNPFNPLTRISFQLKKDTSGDLAIYNTKGQLIKKLYSGEIKANKIYFFNWKGTDSRGRKVTSGSYIYQLRTKDKVYTKKMVLIK